MLGVSKRRCSSSHPTRSYVCSHSNSPTIGPFYLFLTEVVSQDGQKFREFVCVSRQERKEPSCHSIADGHDTYFLRAIPLSLIKRLESFGHFDFL